MTSAVASNISAASSAVPYGWHGSRVSFSRDAADVDAVVGAATSPAAAPPPEPAISRDFIDFEFRLGGSATMLPADELFADGKLLPLRRPAPEAAPVEVLPASEPIRSIRAAAAAAEASDPYVFSPKAPSCSSRWRELLGLRKALSPKPSPAPSPSTTATAATPARSSNPTAARSLKLLLQRNNGRASGAAMSDLAAATLPLLRDSSDSEASLSLSSSRLSLSSSSSSSGHDHDDLPRLSLDSGDLKPNPPRIRLVRSSLSSRAGRSPARRPSEPPPARGLSVDSPRMNSSGKIVFQGLERSSSSPGSFHAGLKARSRAMDRSYSANVRVAPVLNVPVCSLRGAAKSGPVFGGLGQLFKEKKEAAARPRSALGRKVPGRGGGGGGGRSSRDLGN